MKFIEGALYLIVAVLTVAFLGVAGGLIVSYVTLTAMGLI